MGIPEREQLAPVRLGGGHGFYARLLKMFQIPVGLNVIHEAPSSLPHGRMDQYVNKSVSVITQDGRVIVVRAARRIRGGAQPSPRRAGFRARRLLRARRNARKYVMHCNNVPINRCAVPLRLSSFRRRARCGASTS